MKKTNKIKTIALLLGLCICCVSCENDLETQDSDVLKKSVVENPFNEIGLLHNQAVENFAYALNGGMHFTTEDLYRFNVRQGFLDEKETSLGEFTAKLDTIDNVTLDFLLEDNSALQRISSSNIFNSYMVNFKDLLMYSVKSEISITPSMFTSHIRDIENEVIEKYTNTRDTSEMKEYACVLVSLAVAKYSYSHWYNAAVDKQSSWYNIIQERMNQKKKDKDKPSFWDKFASKCADIGNAIGAVCAAAAADVVGAGKAAIDCVEPIVRTDDGGIHGGVQFDIDKVYREAADCSTNAYHDVRN